MKMKRLKTILLALLAMPGSLPLIAQDATEVPKLVISKNDGTTESFLLSELPIIKFKEGIPRTMIISTSSGRKRYLSTYELDKMETQGAGLSKIENLVDDIDATIKWQGDAIWVEVKTGISTLLVYRTNGCEVLSRKLTKGQYTIPLSYLPTGIYIMKIDGRTIKFHKQ